MESMLPIHPLTIHLPVVLIPLLMLGSLVYAFLPVQRPYITWAVIPLAVVAPLSAVVGHLTGDTLLRDLYGGVAPTPLMAEHMDWSERLVVATAALGLASLGLVWARRKGWLWPAVFLTLAVVVISVFSGWFLYEVGHSGSESVWGGRV